MGLIAPVPGMLKEPEFKLKLSFLIKIQHFLLYFLDNKAWRNLNKRIKYIEYVEVESIKQKNNQSILDLKEQVDKIMEHQNKKKML